MVMNVPMILANLPLDVNTFNTVAMIITSVLMIIVIRLPDAGTLRLSVTMEIYVLMIIVILILAAGSLHFLLVTIVMHVPKIIVVK
jgi:phosphatidylserine synthase